MNSPHTCVRSEVARAVIDHVARDRQPGEGVCPVYLDVGIAFVVLKTHVIKRTVLLDQVHFEDQRFKFRSDHNPFNIPDLTDHLACLVSMI